MNYTSSQRHDGVLLAVLRKLFIGKIPAVSRQERLYCAGKDVCAPPRVSVVCGVLVKRSTCFSLQNEQKMQEHLLPAWCIISRYYPRHSGIRKEDSRDDSRPSGVYFRAKQNRSSARRTRPCVRRLSLILISEYSQRILRSARHNSVTPILVNKQIFARYNRQFVILVIVFRYA